MKKTLTLFIGFLFLCLYGKTQDFQYHTGDLLFQDMDCGALCDAIENVTPAVNGKHFSHVGMVYVVQDSVWVIEAIGKDVHLTPLAEFLNRQKNAEGKPKVVVGRLQKAYRHLNARAIGYAISRRGMPYDDEFRINNGKYYCSELVYEAYKEANGQRAFFHLYPMTYKDPATGKTAPAWKQYFKDLGKKIPEGKPGCNPGSIALSNTVEIIREFY